MGDHRLEMDEREAAIRAAADHVERTRKRLDQGKAEIERQQASVSSLMSRIVDRETGDYDDAA